MENDLAKLEKSELINLAKELAWNDEYGCFTRPGFRKMVWPSIAEQAKWIIFLDIDEMGKLNKQHTHQGVNAMIKNSLALRASDYLTGQRYSGDEFMVVVTNDPERGETDPLQLAVRLKEALRDNGLSATFAIAPVISDNLMENVEPAVQLVEQAKERNERGIIIIAPGDPR
jgi:GGDEF domain-containing protein